VHNRFDKNVTATEGLRESTAGRVYPCHLPKGSNAMLSDDAEAIAKRPAWTAFEKHNFFSLVAAYVQHADISHQSSVVRLAWNVKHDGQ
jgi:hypothetical protein